MKTAAFPELASMAFRNLGRHRVKTAVTVTAVAISVALYIFIDGWLLGMNLDSKRNIVAFEAGAARIQSKAWFAKKDELPMYESFGGHEALSARLDEAGFDTAPRFLFEGTLLSRERSAPIAFIAMDPGREAKLLRWQDYVASGRAPVPGRFEIALGSMAAGKLRVDLPARPDAAEFEAMLAAAADADEAVFVRGLYLDAPPDRVAPAEFRRLKPVLAAMPGGKDVLRAYELPWDGDAWRLRKDARPAAFGELAAALRAAGFDFQPRHTLRPDASRTDRDRLWAILAASGRMDVRISTVIDIKELPARVDASKFEAELLPALRSDDRALASRAYPADPASGDRALAEADPGRRDRLLRAMLDAGFAPAVRHVNQLIDAVVVGTVDSPNPKTNGNVAYMPSDALQDEAGMMLEGRITELLVRAKGADDTALPDPGESPRAVKAALGGALPAGLEVYGWLDGVEDYIAASRGDEVSTRVMVGLLFVLSFIGIANTMLMAILERSKETGMLRALGMTGGQVLAVYVMEAAAIGLLGSAIGVAAGCLVNVPMVAYGIDYSGMLENMGTDYGYRVVAFFRSAWNPPVIAASALVATLVSGLMAIPPTLRALKVPVTESLRFE